MAAWMLRSKTTTRQQEGRVKNTGRSQKTEFSTTVLTDRGGGGRTWLQGIRSRTGSAEQTDVSGRTRTETQTANVKNRLTSRT